MEELERKRDRTTINMSMWKNKVKCRSETQGAKTNERKKLKKPVKIVERQND